MKERFEETGIIKVWQEELCDPQCSSVKAQIELFYRKSAEKRNEEETNVVSLIESYGGSIICKSIIPEISYHAILAEIPRKTAENILSQNDVKLIESEGIMFLKASVQSVSISTDIQNTSFMESMPTSPDTIIEEPIIALFDGMPQENHPLIRNLINVDDPDDISSFSTVDVRVHGTSMASLILRGQDMTSIKRKIHKLYVRPIM